MYKAFASMISTNAVNPRSYEAISLPLILYVYKFKNELMFHFITLGRTKVVKNLEIAFDNPEDVSTLMKYSAVDCGDFEGFRYLGNPQSRIEVVFAITNTPKTQGRAKLSDHNDKIQNPSILII